MSEENRESGREQIRQLYAFVANEMSAGASKSDIASKLEQQGVGRSQAEQMVDTIHRDLAATVQREQFTPGALAPALLGGLVAAVLGGAVWAGIVVLTGYEVGFLAWGIGALCGFAVVQAASGRKGTSLQIVAVASSALGILIGKYFAFYYFLAQMLIEQEGSGSVNWAASMSPEVVRIFVENIGEMVGGYDLLWLALAVITAWRIPRGSNISVPGPGAGSGGARA